jgi:hypothetical protein
MKKLIFILAVTMLAMHLPAQVTQNPGPTLKITTLDSLHLQIVATAVPAFHQAVLETSTNLVDWTFISTNTAPLVGGITNIVQTTNTLTFYRVYLP